jgi:hypothetical protein
MRKSHQPSNVKHALRGAFTSPGKKFVTFFFSVGVMLVINIVFGLFMENDVLTKIRNLDIYFSEDEAKMFHLAPTNFKITFFVKIDIFIQTIQCYFITFEICFAYFY